ncbi:hypothetical protein DTO212C5_4839 [Paecilomyces variotii]|nr:hypothetical protein DTO212C5_4839 [Paecilomyces variotii]
MSLRHYLQMAYKEVHLTWDAALSSVGQVEAILQPDHENLILVYGGTFNPPHRGHIDVLLSGLRPEVNALAIVILPCEDYLLRNKMVKSPSDFVLHMQRRADIWEAIPSIPKDRVWVWTSTYFPFKPMIEALIRLTKADGFTLAFAHMIGPDNLRLDDPLMILPYVSPRILVTNKARYVAAQFSPDGVPRVWHGFGEWSRCQYTHSGSNRDNGQGDVVLWTCNGAADDNHSEKRGYYLQFAEPSPVDINSTYLRGALTKSSSINEAKLNQLSIDALLKLLDTIL